MTYDFKVGGSPLQARQSFPIVTFLITFLIIIISIALIWFISKKISEYKKSEKYLNKIKNRITTYKDVQQFTKENNLSNEKKDMLWKVCSITKCPNINFYFKQNSDVTDLFRDAYEKLQKANISAEDLYKFFQLLYKIEIIVAKTKGLLSTKGLPISTTLLYISGSGEQFPFYLVSNTEDGLYLEIPEFMYKTPKGPKTFVPLKFVYKADQGMSYNFVTRIMRYTQSNDNQFLVVAAHTDKLISTSQRNYKREFCEYKCHISPLHLNTDSTKKNVFVTSEHKYAAKITNISAGGCCIQTEMPIKENQHLCIHLTEIGIEEKIVGIIKRTRRFENGFFALHIQFIKISTNAKNEILKRIYKYEL